MPEYSCRPNAATVRWAVICHSESGETMKTLAMLTLVAGLLAGCSAKSGSDSSSRSASKTTDESGRTGGGKDGVKPLKNPSQRAERKTSQGKDLFPSKMMKQPGLVSAVGGLRFKLLKNGPHEILFPMPQLADGQIPVTFHISSTPREAITEYHFQKRENSNVIVSVKLKGKASQEIKIDWRSVILITRKSVSPSKTKPGPYLSATACVQSESKEITALATKLWPKSGKVTDYAKSIQQFVRKMKQRKRPRSLDALGILASGR